MNANRLAKLFLGITIAITGTIGATAAVDISGTYEDKGSVVGSTAENVEIISLHGLLNLDFDPISTDANWGDTSHVVLVDEDGMIEIEIFNGDDQRIWRTKWGARNGFSHEGDAAVIRIQNGRDANRRTVLVARPLNDGEFLEVKAYNIKPSYVGPFSDPVGTYIFVKR